MNNEFLFGTPMSFFNKKEIRIGGQLLSEQGVQKYIASHEKEIQQEEVLKRIRTLLKGNASKNVFEEEHVMVRKKKQALDTDVLYVGNALSVALTCGEYDTVAELAQKQVAMWDGKSVVFRYNAEHSLEMDFAETESVLKELLQKDEQMPDNVWYALWENYAGQKGKWSKKRRFPEANKTSFYEWMKNLLRLKKNRPDLWEEIATEEFKNELLWGVVGDKKATTKKNLTQVVKCLKELRLMPEEQKVFWQLIVNRYRNKTEEGIIVRDRMERFFKVWRGLTGQKIVLDLVGAVSTDLEISDRIEEGRYAGNSFDIFSLEWWLEQVDEFKNAEWVDAEKVLAFCFLDEIHMINALKRDFLTKQILSEAITRAKAEAPEYLPLLILKKHGEFDSGQEAEDDR